MKTTGDSLGILLETLSQQGDSSAFHSLCEPYLRARYHKERNTGISHQEASTHILAEATELFETFVSVPQQQRSQWITEHCQATALVESDSDEILIDKKIVNETAQFLRYCSHELMRTASAYRRKKGAHEKTVQFRLFHSRLLLPVGVPVVIAIAIVLAFFLMHSSGSSITLSFSRHDNTVLFRFPPAPAQETDKPVFSHLPAVALPDSIAADSTSAPVDTTPQLEKKRPPATIVQPKKLQSVPLPPPAERKQPAVRPSQSATPAAPPVAPPSQQMITPPPVAPSPMRSVETPPSQEPDPDPTLPAAPVQPQDQPSENSNY